MEESQPKLAIRRPYVTITVIVAFGAALAALSATLLHFIIAPSSQKDDGGDGDKDTGSSRASLEENLGIAAACIAAVAVTATVMMGVNRYPTFTQATSSIPSRDYSIGGYIAAAAVLAIAGALALAFSVTYIVARDDTSPASHDDDDDTGKDKDKDEAGAASIAYAMVAISTAAMIIPGAIIFFSSKVIDVRSVQNFAARRSQTWQGPDSSDQYEQRGDYSGQLYDI